MKRETAQQRLDRQVMHELGGDNSASYSCDFDRLDEKPYRCHYRILTTRSCLALAEWTTSTGATRYCSKHKTSGMLPIREETEHDDQW